MLPRLGCLFILAPLIELALLIQVGSWIGVWPTIGLVAATGLLGAFLVRHEGVRTLARVQEEVARGALPGQALMDGACILVAGAFLVTPGVLTDIAAFALLFPPSRRALRDGVLRRLERGIREGTVRVRFGSMGAGPFGPSGGAARGTGRAERPAARPDPGDDDDEEGPRPGPRPGEIVQD